MNRFKMMLIGAALVAASSALASAQPVNDRHEGRYEDRDRDRGRDRDNDRRFDRDRDRDDHRNFRDRDDRRFVDRDDRRYFHDRDDYRYRVGDRRFFNGYYWNWDGSRWCRNDRGVRIYFRF